MTIDIASTSQQGGRDYNEDCVRYKDNNSACAVVVADGLGGHGGGEAASLIVAEGITDAFMREPKADAEYIRELFKQANIEVTEAQSEAIKMKSTGVGLFIVGDIAMWAHTGDSRLYFFRDGILETQTLDHSVSQMAVLSGEITQDEIRHHDDRNRLLKAFGGEGFKTDISKELTLSKGSYAFLLCTDGFWEYVLEPEMQNDLAASMGAGEWLAKMEDRVRECAPPDGDNYTAAAVIVNVG